MKQEAYQKHRLFPVLLSLEGLRVVVIGGGTVAERKVRSLLETGAYITIIAPELTQGLQELASSGGLSHISRAYRQGDLKGVSLALAALDDSDAVKAIAKEAEENGALINVADQPELCTFMVPAVMRQGRLCIAVSTEGASPAWARLIKEHLAGEFGQEYARLLDALASVRAYCMQKITDPVVRRKILMKLADESLIEQARSHDVDDLETYLLELVGKWVRDNG